MSSGDGNSVAGDSVDKVLAFSRFPLSQLKGQSVLASNFTR